MLRDWWHPFQLIGMDPGYRVISGSRLTGTLIPLKKYEINPYICMVRMVPQTFMTNNEADELTFEPSRSVALTCSAQELLFEQLIVRNHNRHLRLRYRLKKYNKIGIGDFFCLLLYL